MTPETVGVFTLGAGLATVFSWYVAWVVFIRPLAERVDRAEGSGEGPL